MYWKFKRRLKNGTWRKELYYSCVVICCFLFINIMTIQKNFFDLEGGKIIVTKATERNKKLENVEYKKIVFQESKLSSRSRFRYAFENRLRKLLDIMESNLENPATYNVLENEISFESKWPDRLVFCDDIFNITNMTYIASGWTKAVYKGTFKGAPVALKTVDPKGRDVMTCMETGLSHTTCYVRAAGKLVKEILILQAIANENIIKVFGFCLPRNSDDNLWVAMVTELGEAVDFIKLLQMSWEDRLRVCLDITKIVHSMSNTPYGSMSMNDFRRQQFVLVDGALKLSDVDDTGFEDPTCITDHECIVTFTSANFSHRTKCVLGRCPEYNEKKNLFNGGRHFVTFLLSHGAPDRLKPMINKVIDGYDNLNMTSKQLLNLMYEITNLYMSGWHLYRADRNMKTAYKRTDRLDLPGQHDYRCRQSVSMAACTVSVFDIQEAEDICNMDYECRGYVMSSQKTWTGRILVHMKNGLSPPSFNQNTTLFIKPG